MHITIHIDSDSSASELVGLANFAKELALGRGAHVSTGPTISADEPAQEQGQQTQVQEQGQQTQTAGTEPVKRSRRTKAEIEAEKAAAEAAAAAAIANAQSTVVHENVGQATYDAAPNDATPNEPGPDEFEVAAGGTATTTKNYTEAEIQQIATIVARAHGADAVKNKIAELGGSRIAGLGQEKLNQLGAYLEGLK